MQDIAEGKFNFIFCCAERFLSEEFKSLLKLREKGPDIQLVVMDECHMVETWLVQILFLHRLFTL